MEIAVTCNLNGRIRLVENSEKGRTVLLLNRKLFINKSCPMLVLTTVLGRPRRTDVKTDVKNYQGPTTSRENAIRK